MTHPSGVDNEEDRYQPLPEAIIRTPFRAIHETMWEAEAKFDLLFRRDHSVYVWAANRVQIYYKLAAETAIYDTARKSVQNAAEPRDILVESLPQIDAYIQTGALGPAAANRSRSHGCVYTQDYVRWLLENDRSVLLLHDRPEDLVDHPNLHSLHSRQLAKFAAHHRHLARKKDKCVLDEEGRAFWARVDDFINERLGVRVITPEQIQTWIHGFLAQLVTQRALFKQVQPKVFICMAHYFRAAQIRAAREVGARTIDFQHGINSKFHAGYGFPALKPEARALPNYPDEFWSWGPFWTPQEWFPHKCCDVRDMGHFANRPSAHGRVSISRPEKTLMIATSWAMQSAFKKAGARIAQKLPEWSIVFKLHPREEVGDYLPLVDLHPNVRVIEGDRDVIEASREATAIMSICSSSLFDVLIEDVPIMVLKSEGAEYAEDFVARYGVPVVDQDASNIDECLARAIRQSIPIGEIFAAGRADRIEIAMRSVLGEAPPKYVPKPPLPPERTGFQEKLSGWADRLAASRLQSGTEPIPANQLVAAAAGSKTHGGFLDISQRFWNLVLGRYFAEHPQEHLKILRNAVDDIRTSGEAAMLHSAIGQLIRLGEPTARYRTEFLGLLYWLKRHGQQHQFEEGVDLLVRHAVAEGASSSLPLFEHALTVGCEETILASFNVPRKDRRWHEGAALLARQNPLLEKIVSSLERMAASCDREFLDGRVSEKDAAALAAWLRERIIDGRPFAMMRLGDGEVYGLDTSCYLDATTIEEDRIACEEIWWRKQMDEPTRSRLREGFSAAVMDMDLIGVPSPFRLLRDLPGTIKLMRRPLKSWTRTKRAHVILFRELERMMDEGRLELSGKALCDDRCHQGLFTPDRLRGLLDGVRHVVGVNCFSRDQLNTALGEEIIDDHVLTPPHSKVRDHVPDGPLRDVAMPMVLDELLAGIDDTVRPGSVVLVAGGFAGKLLIHRAKQRGGIVFDIGASADYWMGVDTRGELDFAAYR